MRSRNVTIWVMLGVLLLGCPRLLGVVEFKDGLTYDINDIIHDSVRVDYMAPGMQTTVNLLPAGYITGWLFGFYDSRLNISGGSVGGYLCAYDSSQVTMSGGSIGEFLFAYDNAQVTVTGGNVYGGLQPFDYSHAFVSGGYIEGTFATSDESKGFVSGGSMVDLYAGDNSHITFSGGTSRTWLTADDNGTIRFSGGSIKYGILAGLYDETDTGLIIIEGTNFGVNGTAVEYGEYASDYAVPGTKWGYPCLTGTITGTLESGQYLSENFYIFGNSDITFVPEPSTLLLLGLGGLALRLRSGQAG